MALNGTTVVVLVVTLFPSHSPTVTLGSQCHHDMTVALSSRPVDQPASAHRTVGARLTRAMHTYRRDSHKNRLFHTVGRFVTIRN
jgi:hypothetical protein